MNLFKIGPYFIVFVFVLILTYWIVLGVIVYKSADVISTEGLSGVVENIWCGKKPDCKLPEVK